MAVYEEVIGSISELTDAESESEERIDNLEDEQESSSIRLSDVEIKLSAVYPENLKFTLQRALSFVEQGGPDFVATEAEQKKLLTDTQELSSKRNEFKMHFSQAQLYIDSRSGDQRDYEKELGTVSRAHKKAEMNRNEQRRLMKQLTKKLPGMRKALESIDKATYIAN